MLTQEALRSVLHYDPDTGVFTWRAKIAQRQNVGDVAGFVCPEGYRRIKICRKQFKAHRLAWLYMTGELPPFEIDHRDRVRSNNVWTNLRKATHKQNQENRTTRRDSSSGFKGVLWSNRDQAWRTTICIGGRKRHIGTHGSLLEAVAQRIAAERKHCTHSPYREAA